MFMSTTRTFKQEKAKFVRIILQCSIQCDLEIFNIPNARNCVEKINLSIAIVVAIVDAIVVVVVVVVAAVTVIYIIITITGSVLQSSRIPFQQIVKSIQCLGRTGFQQKFVFPDIILQNKSHRTKPLNNI